MDSPIGDQSTVSLRTPRFIRKRIMSIALAVVTIGFVSVIGASLLVTDFGNHRATAAVESTSEAAFLAENVAAMKTMMNAMHVKSTGNVDLDFVTMMVPHHQGAIDMAMAVLRHGRNERVK